MPYIDILIFSLIAIFLIMRLKSILGSKDGFEKENSNPNNVLKRDNFNKDNDIVDQKLQSINKKASNVNAKGIKSVEKFDKSFNKNEFSEGAKEAYKLILKSFSDQDFTQLKRLLSFELFENFSESIRNRNKNEEELSISINSFEKIEVIDGQVENNISSVTVKYITNQTRTLLDKNSNLIEDESLENSKVTDIWIFEKEINSEDPNWKLVETKAVDEN